MDIAIKHRLWALLLIQLLVLHSGHLFAEDKRKFLIDPVTTAINGITISSQEKDVLKSLGRPKSVKKRFDEFMEKPSKELNYEGIRINLIEGNIYGLSCKKAKCHTDRGVSVGNDKKKVIELYGEGNPPYSGATHDSLSYPLKGIDSYLIFIFKDHKVIEIKFFVDYT